jgi:hypothetical protein
MERPRLHGRLPGPSPVLLDLKSPDQDLEARPLVFSADPLGKAPDKLSGRAGRKTIESAGPWADSSELRRRAGQPGRRGRSGRCRRAAHASASSVVGPRSASVARIADFKSESGSDRAARSSRSRPESAGSRSRQSIVATARELELI